MYNKSKEKMKNYLQQDIPNKFEIWKSDIKEEMEVEELIIKDEDYVTTDDMNNEPNILEFPLNSENSSVASGISENYMSLQTYAYEPLVEPHMLDSHGSLVVRGLPYLSIKEQPMAHFRFCSTLKLVRTPSFLMGKNFDTSLSQTFPTVQLHNYDTPAVIRCTLYQYVQENSVETRKPHAHRLIKSYGRKVIDDPHNVNVDEDCGYTAVFHGLRIIKSSKTLILSELVRRNTILKHEEIGITEGRYRPLLNREDLEAPFVCGLFNRLLKVLSVIGDI